MKPHPPKCNLLADFIHNDFKRNTLTIDRNIKKSSTGHIIERIDKKIVALAQRIDSRGEFKLIPLQKLVKMQLGSILIVADVLSNGKRSD